MNLELKDGTPLVLQITEWDWDSTPCQRVGDLGRIRLANHQLIYVQLCRGKYGGLWLVKRNAPTTMIARERKFEVRSRLIPAIHLLQRIAEMDTGELTPQDRPDNLRGFKKFQRHAVAAVKQLREMADSPV